MSYVNECMSKPPETDSTVPTYLHSAGTESHNEFMRACTRVPVPCSWYTYRTLQLAIVSHALIYRLIDHSVRV